MTNQINQNELKMLVEKGGGVRNTGIEKFPETGPSHNSRNSTSFALDGKKSAIPHVALRDTAVELSCKISSHST